MEEAPHRQNHDCAPEVASIARRLEVSPNGLLLNRFEVRELFPHFTEYELNRMFWRSSRTYFFGGDTIRAQLISNVTYRLIR